MATKSNILNGNHPAFPVQAYPGDGSNPKVRPNTGMSMRDWFAGKAVEGILSNPEDSFRDVDFKDAADFAYNIANAMLERREKL